MHVGVGVLHSLTEGLDAQPPGTQATVGGSPFGPFISVARGHSREQPLYSYAILRFLYVLH